MQQLSRWKKEWADLNKLHVRVTFFFFQPDNTTKWYGGGWGSDFINILKFVAQKETEILIKKMWFLGNYFSFWHF